MRVENAVMPGTEQPQSFLGGRAAGHMRLPDIRTTAGMMP